MQTTVTQWGASTAEWDHFSRALGLTADLLPVVSNPNATISALSKMADLGKTPSQYNRAGEAVGIPKWTQAQTTAQSIARWRAVGDLGICVQTRRVRAIDVDIADAEAARRVLDVIELCLDRALPMRTRANSGKFLLAFVMPGPYAKRIIRTGHGAIEFLATGQQFIAAGTHPSGARYEWTKGLPAELPELTPNEFEALWVQLAELFATSAPEPARGLSRGVLKPRVAGDIKDPVVSFLDATGWVTSYERSGLVNVRCPWAGEHTTDTGGSSTTWFPAGVGGFEQGHFRCLHAHCEHRTDQEFLDITGYVTADFAELPVTEFPDVENQAGARAVIEQAAMNTIANGGTIVPTEPPPLPAFRRKRDGSIESTVSNLTMALRRPDVCRVLVAHDEFRDELMVADYTWGDDPHAAQWRPFADADYVRIRLGLERGGFQPISKELARDVVALVASENRMDTAIEWLTRRVPAWDGVPRVEKFWHSYFGVENTPYTRACGLYAWTALAGRVLSPGVQADMVPVLIGRQGVRKTTGIKAMAPHPDQFVELSLDARDTDLSRSLRGKLVAELGELRGLNSRDSESIKQWITRTHEEWTPKFKEFGVKFARRMLIIGSTNRDEFLADQDGEERRWLPMVAQREVLREAIERDRDQLWAEGKVLFERNGVMWQQAQALAAGVHADHTIEDPWTPHVVQWLLEPEFGDEGKTPRGHGRFKIQSLMLGGLGISTQNVTRGDELRVGRILRLLGYEKRKLQFEGSQAKGWVPLSNCKILQIGESAENSVDDLA